MRPWWPLLSSLSLSFPLVRTTSPALFLNPMSDLRRPSFPTFSGREASLGDLSQRAAEKRRCIAFRGISRGDAPQWCGLMWARVGGRWEREPVPLPPSSSCSPACTLSSLTVANSSPDDGKQVAEATINASLPPCLLAFSRLSRGISGRNAAIFQSIS